MYVHLEVQGSAQAEFAERMFVYHYRLFDRYRQPVASPGLVSRHHRQLAAQNQFGYQALGCSIELNFPTASCWTTLPSKTSYIKILIPSPW